MRTKPNAPLPTNPDDVAVPRPEYPQFAPGARVRDIFGKEHVVSEQVGCAVYMRGTIDWFHPRKVFAVD